MAVVDLVMLAVLSIALRRRLDLALDSRASSSSSNDFAKLATPSSSSTRATSARSMPRSASFLSVRCASPGSASTVRAIVPWSKNASIVWSGIVLTVSGPISQST